MTDPPQLTGWVSQLFHRPIELSVRTSPDQIPAAREFWDLTNLPHLLEDLPNLEAVHEGVVLRERDRVTLAADVYVPQGEGPFPTLLYMHGGSWVLWSARHLKKFCMQIAERGFVVVNLEYGLAPEHPYPWAVEDSVYAARWVTKHASAYKGDASALLIGGDSAGANLAAAVISTLNGLEDQVDGADLAGMPVNFGGALLLYGIFDFPLLFAEPGGNANGGIIETTWNLAYLGPNFVKRHRLPTVSPIYAPNLASFPPCYLTCGARDALLPQTLAFVKALVEAGVSTTASVVEGADHAFVMMPDIIEGAGRENERIFAWLVEQASGTRG